MCNHPFTVHTHAPRQAASRLTEWRLKQAAIERDARIADANERYERQIRAIAGRDRPATLALRRLQRSNYLPWKWRRSPNWVEPSVVLAHPFASAIEPFSTDPRPPHWMFNGEELLRRHGYKPSRQYREAAWRG